MCYIYIYYNKHTLKYLIKSHVISMQLTVKEVLVVGRFTLSDPNDNAAAAKSYEFRTRDVN